MHSINGDGSKTAKISQKVAEVWRFNGFKMAAVRHLRFLNSIFFNVGVVERTIWRHRTKFHTDRSNRCGDIAIFVIFKMAVAAILNFQKFEILTAGPLRHRAKYHQNRSNSCRDIAI